MFLIQAPQIQVGTRKPWGELRGPPEIRFRGDEIVLLRVDNAQEVVNPWFPGEPHKHFPQFAPGSAQVTGLD
jgi:hypothetical protein